MLTILHSKNAHLFPFIFIEHAKYIGPEAINRSKDIVKKY